MSSLLTNTSAMVALQTLKSVNRDTADVQNQISTGKQIANARDNAALWGIAATMESDVSGFRAISESLSLGTATLTVGRDAAEAVTSLLDQLKGKIVAAQEENVDRSKIQADVDALREQVRSVVNAAQFNGLNLLKGHDTVSILASLNRDENQQVTTDQIRFSTFDLTETEEQVGGANIEGTPITEVGDATLDNTWDTAEFAVAAVADGGGGAGTTTTTLTFTLNDGTTETLAVTWSAATLAADAADDIRDAFNANPRLAAIAEVDANGTDASPTFTARDRFAGFTVTAATADTGEDITGGGITLGGGAADVIAPRATGYSLTGREVVPGDQYVLTLSDGTDTREISYMARGGDTLNDVAEELKLLIDAEAATAGSPLANVTTNVRRADDPTTEAVVLQIDNDSATGITVTPSDTAGGTPEGGLFDMKAIDVTTQEGANAAIAVIDPMIQQAINAAARFGSAQGRIDTQSDFISRIMDGLTSGIGALVDADMEAASARLQALQVQQQLGVQALNIANQQPQNILALFRQ